MLFNFKVSFMNEKNILPPTASDSLKNISRDIMCFFLSPYDTNRDVFDKNNAE
jgi:hypothetical protein